MCNSCSRRRRIFVRKPAQSRGLPTPRRASEPTTDPYTVFYPRQRHVTSTSARHVGVTSCSVLGHEANRACTSPSGTSSPPPHTPRLHAPVLVVPSGCEPRSPDVSVSHQTVFRSRNNHKTLYVPLPRLTNLVNPPFPKFVSGLSTSPPTPTPTPHHPSPSNSTTKMYLHCVEAALNHIMKSVRKKQRDFPCDNENKREVKVRLKTNTVPCCSERLSLLKSRTPLSKLNAQPAQNSALNHFFFPDKRISPPPLQITAGAVNTKAVRCVAVFCCLCLVGLRHFCSCLPFFIC